MSETTERIIQEKDSTVELLSPEKKVLAFRLPEASTNPEDDPPDEFYELTSSEVIALYKELQNKRKELEEEPLLTKRDRDKIEAQKRELIDIHTEAVIRVEFFDRTVLQMVVKPEDTIASIREIVSSYINPAITNFTLFVAPPKTVLENTQTVKDCRLVPAGKVYFKSEEEIPEGTNYLKEEVLSNLCSHEAANQVADSVRSREKTKKKEESTNKTREDSTNKTKDGQNAKTPEDKAAKLLKLLSKSNAKK